MTLEEFTLQVKSSEIWMNMIHSAARGKDLNSAIAKVYGQVVSDETLLTKPIQEHRKHIFNTLTNQAFSKVTGVQTHQPATPEEKKTVVPVKFASDEERNKILEEWKEKVKAIQVKPVPRLTHKQIAEEGDWIPKKKVVVFDTGYAPEHYKKIHEGRVKTVRDRHPEFSEEQVEQYIQDKFGNVK